MVATGPRPMLVSSECCKCIPSLPGTGQALCESGGLASVSSVPR